jgi:hypothetical protein
MNFYQEVAQSHVDALVSKISALSLKNIPDFLKKICTKISESITKKIGFIRDDKDLKQFRFYISYIAELVDIFSKTSPDVSSSWASPLIKECYGKIGIGLDTRQILIIHAEDSPSYAVYSDILLDEFKKRV